MVKLPLHVRAEFGAQMNPTLVNARPRRRFTFLPLLVFLFAVSYGLLTVLVVLQDRTIDAQSDLIHLLFKESRRLNTMAAQYRQTSGVKNSEKQANKAAQVPSVRVPRTQVPSTQVQKSQSASAVPSSQEKAGALPGKSQHQARRRAPSQPPVETTDPSDMRRTLFSI